MIHRRLVWADLKEVWALARISPAGWSPLQRLRVRNSARASPDFRAFMKAWDPYQRCYAWKHRRRGVPVARWDSAIELTYGWGWREQIA
eukprot:9346995-Lingulodinium_polyedra.AAC.1